MVGGDGATSTSRSSAGVDAICYTRGVIASRVKSGSITSSLMNLLLNIKFHSPLDAVNLREDTLVKLISRQNDARNT